jgi:ribosomal protein S18 acetylase RimI-like enzyme
MIPNPFYAALTSANAPFAVHNGPAARYQREIIPFGAVAERTPGAMKAFRDLLAPGESLFTTAGTGETFPQTPGLACGRPLPGLQMEYAGTAVRDGEDDAVVRLTDADMPEMFALKTLAFPGYFGPRANLLGDFFGIRASADGALIAMAGERLSTFTHREVSAVCTHPQHLGRGHATRLMHAVMRAQFARDARSILHVIAANARAISLYQHLGFEIAGEVVFHRFTRGE